MGTIDIGGVILTYSGNVENAEEKFYKAVATAMEEKKPEESKKEVWKDWEFSASSEEMGGFETKFAGFSNLNIGVDPGIKLFSTEAGILKGGISVMKQGDWAACEKKFAIKNSAGLFFAGLFGLKTE